MNTKAAKRINTAIIYTFLTILLIIAIFPILYIFLASFKDTQELMTNGASFFPKKITIINYISAWKSGKFSAYTANSFIYSGATTIITIMFSTAMGFVLNRKEFALKKFIMGSLVGSMFIAGAVTMYPIFLMVVKAKLNKTLLGLIFATLGGSQILGTFLVNSYLNGIPKELDEAAIIDGCSMYGLYYKIILPVIKPVIGVIGLITFQSTWNNYMLPLCLTMANPNNRTLAVGVNALAYTGNSQVAAQWDLLIAGSCMAMIPILIIYLFANKYFVSGLTVGAVKL